MAQIKSLNDISKKWTTVTPQRQADYEQGIRAPRRDWEDATTQGATNYAQGVQTGITNKRFEKGVTEAGTETWRKGSLEKGLQRWGQGVTVAKESYERGFSPYREVISRVELPPKGPKGSPQNYNRVQVLGNALHEAKMGNL